ncbi:polyphosphate kinase [Haloferula luteola]|uniref:Polyphosphate kinase n=1 Tax=Haloferula luteola TaxID=595692 RepID=A0A840VB64_9BACT|nr:polyphosphate kinase 1 [Haloferula luteola]MBB5351180.1 polyphosphate kinase [Haloferula luteola]
MLPYLNRELSWLEFNQRVLNEALRVDLPLLERLKFLAITASNLDEFFQVRVGGLMLMRRSGRQRRDLSGLTPHQQIQAIRKRVLQFMEDQYQLLAESLLPELESHGLLLLSIDALDSTQAEQVAASFHTHVGPLLTPLAIDPEGPPPHVPALQITLACRLTDDETGAIRDVLVPVPEILPRRIPVDVPGEAQAFVLIEEVIARHAESLFPGETLSATATFRVTRNGDIAVQEEDAIDLAGEMEDVLAARKIADTVRLELGTPMPRELGKVIQDLCRASSAETYRCPGPLGLSGFMELAFIPGFDELRDAEWPAQPSPALPPNEPVFDAIARGDILLHHPYESFEPIVRFIAEAAVDPDVLSIKQVLYRTAKNSRIIDALIRAAENGKQVTVLVELKARFDEARNLVRAEELQRAGAQIVYGVKGLKTHAKICMVVRRESGRLRRYVHLGTGNYNESTSRLYTDISLLTCRPEFGADASIFFNAVTGRSKLLRFQRLVPAPTAMKPRLLSLIASEAERARQGETARITAKVNSLQDPEIIAALYDASAAGVTIQLNVRGICCLKPGNTKMQRNITVISIIDRYLEHARIFHFHNGGDPEVFIASADWMGRNLDRRVELMVPIEDARARRRLIKTLDTFFRDNSQASRILPDGTSEKIRPSAGEKTFRAQEHFFREARKSAKAHEHERAMRFEPHLPQD